MISAFKIHDTVVKVTSEAEKLLPDTTLVNSENDLLLELVLCILSSQEKYEVALALVKEFQKESILKIPQNQRDLNTLSKNIKDILGKPIHFIINSKKNTRRLRFFIKKGEYIIKTIENIYLKNKTITEILYQDNCVEKTRKAIIEYSYGIGPKQASMFLRNIGYHYDFAILDKHIIDYMRIMGINSAISNKFSNLSSYLRIEKKLKKYAAEHNLNLFHLDIAIWTTMRTLKNSTHE